MADYQAVDEGFDGDQQLLIDEQSLQQALIEQEFEQEEFKPKQDMVAPIRDIWDVKAQIYITSRYKDKNNIEKSDKIK